MLTFFFLNLVITVFSRFYPSDISTPLFSENKPKKVVPVIVHDIKKIESDEINNLIGKFNYRTNSDFIVVPTSYCSKVIYLRKEVFSKFEEMYEAAKKDGVTLTIISGTRNYEEQKIIWNNKWSKYKPSLDSMATAKKILLFSSMPCTSRHHWGTDMDLINLETSFFESGKGLLAYRWLCANASRYGFCQVYDDKKTTNRTGYECEKWHWSYLPLSSKYLASYNKLVDYSMISGFSGSNLAKKMNTIELYVNGINSTCK